MNDASEIRSALASARTVAVVGCSPNPDRPSNAIARGAGFFFMQQGVVDAASARLLEAAGIPVAMDRCILVEHASRGLPARNFDGLDER